MKGDILLTDEAVEIQGRLKAREARFEEVEIVRPFAALRCDELQVQRRVTCDELNVRGADLLEHLDKVENAMNQLRKAITVVGNKVYGQFADVQISDELKVQGSDFGQRVFNIERQLDELSRRLKALEG